MVDIKIETRHVYKVETRHALSLAYKLKRYQKNLRALVDIKIETRHVYKVETRHALSLQQRNKTIGQKRFQNQGNNTVLSIIDSYKFAGIRHANRLGYTFGWQTRFYDHILRDKKSYNNIYYYIFHGVKKWF